MSLEPNDDNIARNATDSVENKMDDVMVTGVLSNDPSSQLESTTKLRKFLSLAVTSNVDEVIQSGVVPRLVEFLDKEDYTELQLEAACILGDIAFDKPEVVIEHGAVPIFIKLLVSPNDDITEESMWALGNVAGASSENRDHVLNFGALKNLFSKMFTLTIKTSTLNRGLLTLYCICRCPPQGSTPLYDQVKHALPIVKRYLLSDDEVLLSHACWTLWYMCYGSDEGIKHVIEHRFVPQLVQLLQHDSSDVLTPVCRLIRYILYNKKHIQRVIDVGAVPILANFLTNEYEKSIKMEAFWMIRYITAGTEDQFQSVINAHLIPILVNLAQNAEMDIKMEAVSTISYASSGGSGAQVKYLVEKSCIKPLCDFLVCEDLKIVLSCLNGLEKILKVGLANKTRHYRQLISDAEGLEKIENLHTHLDEQIKDKAAKILKKYWLDEEDEDED